MKFLNVLLISILALCAGTFAADSGGVSEALQVWAGKKVFLDNSPVSTTLTGAGTLYFDSGRIQRMDPGGSSRNVTLPAVAVCQGYDFFIINTADAAENLVMKNAGASTIVTIHQNNAGFLWCDGSAWYGIELAASAAGQLTADGLTPGATSSAQDFGANGIKADILTGSTGTTGNFNINLTDNLASSLNVKEATNSYLKFVTTNAAEKIQLGVDLDFPAARNVTVLDNSATALVFEEASNAYLTLVTTNASEAVKVSKTLNVAAPLKSIPATVQDISTGNTITLPTAGFTQRLTLTAGVATGVILTAGTDGQVVTLINVDTTDTLTFATSGTSHVADGTSAAITALSAMTLVYDGTTSLWYRTK